MIARHGNGRAIIKLDFENGLLMPRNARMAQPAHRNLAPIVQAINRNILALCCQLSNRNVAAPISNCHQHVTRDAGVGAKFGGGAAGGAVVYGGAAVEDAGFAPPRFHHVEDKAGDFGLG